MNTSLRIASLVYFAYLCVTWHLSRSISEFKIPGTEVWPALKQMIVANEMLLAHCPVDCGNWDPNSNFLQQETWASHASLIGHEGWLKGGQFLRRSRSCSVKICQGRWGEAQVVLGCCLAQVRSDVWVQILAEYKNELVRIWSKVTIGRRKIQR